MLTVFSYEYSNTLTDNVHLPRAAPEQAVGATRALLVWPLFSDFYLFSAYVKRILLHIKHRTRSRWTFFQSINRKLKQINRIWTDGPRRCRTFGQISRTCAGRVHFTHKLALSWLDTEFWHLSWSCAAGKGFDACFVVCLREMKTRGAGGRVAGRGRSDAPTAACRH